MKQITVIIGERQKTGTLKELMDWIEGLHIPEEYKCHYKTLINSYAINLNFEVIKL